MREILGAMKRFRTFVKKSDWVFAKTYAHKAPHEYVTIYKSDKMEFYFVVKLIREIGFTALYGNYENTYFILDNYYYWTMGDEISRTIVLNRAKVENYDLIDREWKVKREALYDN